MQEAPFWENVTRFMRFGITSISGLIFGLLSPFRAFLRTPTLTAIGASILIGVLVFVFLTLQTMQGQTDAYAPPAAGLTTTYEVKPDPSMQKMLQDIYGP